MQEGRQEIVCLYVQAKEFCGLGLAYLPDLSSFKNNSARLVSPVYRSVCEAPLEKSPFTELCSWQHGFSFQSST